MSKSIIDALYDPILLGGHPAFRDLASWRAWLVFLKACYGLALRSEELEVFRKHTGRASYDPPEGGYREACAIVGRQSGKSRVAAAISTFEAAIARGEEDRTATYAILVAQDYRASLRSLFDYVQSNFREVPLFSRLLSSRKAAESMLHLRTGTVVAAYPCRPEAIRGLRARVVVCDELAFFRTSEYRPVDKEMLRAVRPTLATTGGRLIILSSPHGQAGALWDLHNKHFGREDSPVLVWQAAAAEMNPTLPADYLARMEEEDPEAYRSEVLGEFRSGIGHLFDPEALEACVIPERRELPPGRGIDYYCFCDPSGGRRDAFTLAVGHKHEDYVIVDCLRVWHPPFDPSQVVREAVQTARAYGCWSVEGDRYAGEWPRAEFRRLGCAYEVCERPRSDLYLALLPLVNSRRIELLDNPELLRELRGLERRSASSGKDSVDHLPGAHDDRANVVAGLSYQLLMGGRGCQVVPYIA